MVGPILFCVIVTLIYFMLAIHAAFSLKDHVVDSGNMRYTIKTACGHDNKDKLNWTISFNLIFRTLLWMDLTLLPICGMVWTLCLLGANERSSFWQYSISGSVLLLSLYIALGYCILNQRVKDSLYIRAGNLFRPHEESQQQNVSVREAESNIRYFINCYLFTAFSFGLSKWYGTSCRRFEAWHFIPWCPFYGNFNSLDNFKIHH